MREPVFGHLPDYLKLLMLGLIILASLLFSMLLGVLLAMPFFGTDVMQIMTELGNLQDPRSLSMLKFMQVINQVGMFIIPSVLFSFLVYRSIPGYMKLDVKPGLTSTIIGSMAILVSLPLIGWLAELNESLNLPDSLQGVEDWMKTSEDQARVMTEAFLSAESTGGFLFNIFMIAIIPAIGEEMLFRGVLIRLFRDWIKNVHVAVILSSVLFSALHLQFFGFLPRLVLGMMLGYMFVWSGSLWLPVIVHFVNNAFAVAAIYLSNKKIIETDVESLGTTDNFYIILLSLVLVVILLFQLYKIEHKQKLYP